MRWKSEKPSLLAGCLFALFGLAGLLESALLASKAERATATVIDAVFVHRGYKGRSNYDVSVSYRTVDGNTERAVLKNTSEAPITPGARVAILYQSDDPQDIRFDSFAKVWGIPTGLTLFGLFLIVVAYLGSYVSDRNRSRPLISPKRFRRR
jgi:hypothetical protein